MGDQDRCPGRREFEAQRLPFAGIDPAELRLAGIALAVMGGGLWFAAGTDADWLRWGLAERLARLTALTTLGAAAYFATLWALGFRLNDFKRRAA